MHHRQMWTKVAAAGKIPFREARKSMIAQALAR
jgi:hypothetical protein